MINKILCIGGYSKPSNSYLRTLSFEELGFVVERVDVNDHFSRANIFFRIIRKIIWRPLFRKKLVKLVKEKITDFSPELVFVEKGVDFDSRDLKSFKALLSKGSKIAHLNPDDPFGYFRSGWKKFISSIPLYDCHFVPKEVNRDDYLKLSAPSVFVYDRSFDLNYHKPAILSYDEEEYFRCGVGFIGSYAPHRESVINAIVNDGIDVMIWGDGWSKGKYWNKLKYSWRAGTQTGDDYIKAITGMSIALHFVRHENRDLQDSRTFEIPACGTFMLAERTSEHERLFAEDKEVVFFDSSEDCIAKCRYYLNDSDLRVQIAKAGMQRVHDSNYDYTSRARAMIEAISKGSVEANSATGVF